MRPEKAPDPLLKNRRRAAATLPVGKIPGEHFSEAQSCGAILRRMSKLRHNTVRMELRRQGGSSLKEYQRKRNFRRTPEPAGKLASAAGAGRFVIQKHAASRLHYDFRLELDGTLKSWAVPRGMPFAKGEKRLAVEVEDHPVSYAGFEGTIPKGQYGGGTVMLWDTGTYVSLSGSPLRAWEAGKIHFQLSGQKLRGEWYLVRLRDEK